MVSDGGVNLHPYVAEGAGKGGSFGAYLVKAEVQSSTLD